MENDKSNLYLCFFRYYLLTIFRKMIIFALDFGFPKRETFRNRKIKKLSKTENFYRL